MENNKKILLFHVADTKCSQIAALCRTMDITAVLVKDTQWGVTLGSLAGISGLNRLPVSSAHQPETAVIPPLTPSGSMEMMVFSGISQNELDAFLTKYREAGIPKIPLKAVLTPYNIFWNATQLYQELQKEHSHFQKQI